MLILSMKVLEYENKERHAIVAEAVRVLESGGILAYPTESFYALGVLASDEKAVKKLYQIKNRPYNKPFPLIAGSMETVAGIVKSVPEKARVLMDRYWPGPLTILLDAEDHVPSLLTGHTGKIAVRVPGRSVALELAIALSAPVTATSANPSGMPPAKDAADVIRYFEGKIEMVIDAGIAPGGNPSTIIDMTVEPPEILRQGSVSINGIFV